MHSYETSGTILPILKCGGIFCDVVSNVERMLHVERTILDKILYEVYSSDMSQ
jgi:hypothetical protein